MSQNLRVGLTQGDTNGIGLETVLKAIAPEGITELFTPVVFGNRKLVFSTAGALRGETPLKFYSAADAASVVDGRLNLVSVGEAEVTPQYGTPTPESGRAALESLEAACEALAAGDIDVLVTAPISKEAIQSDDFRFPGHTEYLQDRLGAEGDKAQMILFNDDMRVALLTTHLPISKVAEAVTRDAVVEAVKRFDRTLRRDFGCERPRIAVLALNPHCGDGGLLGDEERREIVPAIEALHDGNILAFGPYAADGFFGEGLWKKFDGILAMYHDQGLAPFKTVASKE